MQVNISKIFQKCLSSVFVGIKILNNLRNTRGNIVFISLFDVIKAGLLIEMTRRESKWGIVKLESLM